MDEKLAAYCSPFASISNFTVKSHLGVLMLLVYENGQQVNCDKIGFFVVLSEKKISSNCHEIGQFNCHF